MFLDNTMHTEHKYFKFINKHQEQDKALLKELAKYLKEDTLNKFVSNLSKEEELAHSDCFSLIEVLHKYGINVRYYGKLLKLIENDSSLKKLACWINNLYMNDIF
jgi:hypothetical protein